MDFGFRELDRLEESYRKRRRILLHNPLFILLILSLKLLRNSLIFFLLQFGWREMKWKGVRTWWSF